MLYRGHIGNGRKVSHIRGVVGLASCAVCCVSSLSAQVKTTQTALEEARAELATGEIPGQASEPFYIEKLEAEQREKIAQELAKRQVEREKNSEISGEQVLNLEDLLTGIGNVGGKQKPPVAQIVKLGEGKQKGPKFNEVTKSKDTPFEVYGGTAKARSNVASVAEGVYRGLISSLKEEVNKASGTPIQLILEGDPLKKIPKIDAKGRRLSPYRRAFGNKASGGFYLSLKINQSLDITYNSLRSAIAEMILLERSLSAKKALGEQDRMVLHAWVVDGLLEMADWKAKRSRRMHYEELALNTKHYKLEQLLGVKRAEVERMDAISYRTYRAAAGAMVMALFEQKGGLKGIKSLLSELSFFEGDMRNLLKRHFPEMNKGGKGERIAWLIQLNTMAMAPLSERYSILETEVKLSEVLRLRVLDEDGVQQVFAMEDLEAFLKMEPERRKAAVNLASKRLVQLQFRCYPLYESMLSSYATHLNALSAEPTEKQVELLTREIENKADERSLIRSAAIRARDYMDWYVIQHAYSVEGDYSKFDKLEKELEKEWRLKKPSRLDTYLDRLDAFYE